MNFPCAKRFVLLVAICVCTISSRAQAPQVDIEEFRRLQGELADLRDANAAQNRRITELQKEIQSIREAVRESNERNTTRLADFSTREELKRAIDKIQEVDQKREADKKVILGEFEKLGKTLVQTAAERPSRPSRSTPDPEPEPPAQPIEGTFYPYKVQRNETLGEIIEKFNQALVKEGRPRISLSQVRRANPKINVDLIYVGQELLLPVPDKK